MSTQQGARRHSGLRSEPLSVDAAHHFVADPGAGAVVVFTGTVRDETDGRPVAGLSYEAYAEKAEPLLIDLAADITVRWPSVRAVWLEHRVGGPLAVGEPSVVVGVSAAHRAEAFDAARHGIDTLKEAVPIWKQEHWREGGSHWPGTT